MNGARGGGETDLTSRLAGPGLVRWPGALRAAAYVGLFVLGALTGVSGALVRAGWFPGGLLLALAAAVCLFGGGAKLTRTKVGAVVPAAGWLVAVMLLTRARPEGDFLFGTGISSYAFLFGGMLGALFCATISLPTMSARGDRHQR